MRNTKPFIYNPAQKTKEQLIAEFVVRKNVFEKLLNEIKTSQRDVPPQHHLVAGQRGMGKTTLLLRLMYAIEDDPELKDFLIPIRFSEEQYNIVGLERLWEETAALLEYKSSIYLGLQDEIQEYENVENYERICFEILAKKLKQNTHRVVLLIDNIGELLEKFPAIQNNRLREILMTSPYIQLVGCSSKVLEHTFHYDKPFFEFFHQIKLEPLNQSSTLELLKALGKEYHKEESIDYIIKNDSLRIEVLRRITGGVPRTLVLLFDIFIDRKDGNAFEDLQHLLDSVNSIYKHRMDELKPQQQQIIDTLARAWDAISASEVLEKSKLYRDGVKSNQVSAQLKQLTENQVVETVEGTGRKQTYRIRERFFNIWYLMRHGRKQNQEEVLWLIKFLEAWCAIKDLKSMTEDHIERMKSGQYSENADYYKSIATHSLDGIYNESKLMVLNESEIFFNDKENGENALSIKNYNEGLRSSTILGKIKEAIDNNDLDYLENLMLETAKINKEFLYSLGDFYYTKRKDYTNAEKYFLMSVENNDVRAMFSLGNFYRIEKEDYEKAEVYYLMAVENGHIDSINNLALIHKMKGDFKEAENLLLKAVEHNQVKSMFNLGHLYLYEFKNFEKAEKYLLKAIEFGCNEALSDIAMLYFKVKKDNKTAEDYFLKALEKNKFDFIATYNYILLLIKTNEIQSALNFSHSFFYIEEVYNYLDKVISIILELMIHKQYNFLLKLFLEENSPLMKHASAFYYALAYFMKDELPGVYDSTGSEIKETVDEIIKEIEEKLSK